MTSSWLFFSTYNQMSAVRLARRSGCEPLSSRPSGLFLHRTNKEIASLNANSLQKQDFVYLTKIYLRIFHAQVCRRNSILTEHLLPPGDEHSDYISICHVRFTPASVMLVSYATAFTLSCFSQRYVLFLFYSADMHVMTSFTLFSVFPSF